ncbi:MAG: hypothetical protein M3Q56_01415, partial [Bacteroidota bacterium]|nr:hypothetical protein [Bacteroidota bacterium]
FITYCFLQKPEFFEAYIAISPNFGFDKFQFVRRFKNFDFNKIKQEQFFYMCNSNEDVDFAKSWKTGRDSIIQILNSTTSKEKIKFINEDFSQSEDHSSVYPLGVRNGLKLFFDYYHNAENLMSFYEEMYRQKKFDLTPENTNYMAYNFLWSHKPKDAIKIIHWANKLFPDDLNIIDGMGELYNENRDKETAIKYWKVVEKKLEEQKKDMLTTEKYDELKNNHDERMKSLEDK